MTTHLPAPTPTPTPTKVDATVAMTPTKTPASTITPPSSSSRPFTSPITTTITATATAPASTTPPPTSVVTNALFQRNPSIRIKKEKKKSSKADKDIDRSHDNNNNHIHLKRSRSPIKLIKNIKSYLHVHKHKYSSSSVSSISTTNNTFLSSSSASGTLAPPSRNSFDGPSSNQYRSTSLPSSSILSAAASQLAQEDPTAAAAAGIPSRVPREKQRSEAMDPEKQVLLLRVMSYFEHAGHRADEETAEYLLSSYQWNIDHTLQYCQDLLQAVHGTLVPVQQEIVLGGAVNDQMTSCYIDALLFAMFARLSAFEGLLNVNLDAESDSDSEESGTGAPDTGPSKKDEERLHTHRLQTWLRMFVNQLRSGRLIQAHVVKELRQHLYCCGWNCPGPMDPPGSSRQEDSSELFMFLTEKLHLPYLPLEQRLLHGAKISADDDKVITERMLQISIPTPDQPAASESSQVSKLGSTFSKLMSSSKSTDSNGSISNQTEPSSMFEVLSLESLLTQYFYDNTLTGIRRTVSSGTGVPLSPGVEIPVSAWQVLELLPFYSSSNEQGGVIHASRSQYPSGVLILPLILKRYSFGQDMQARRIGTPIDIPRRIDFSRFVNPQTTASPPPHMATAAGRSSGATLKPTPAPVPAPAPESVPASESAPVPASIDTTPTLTTIVLPPPLSIPENRSTLDASSSVRGLSAISINTQIPPIRKYSMSLLQAAESPRTPITPPPQYSPAQQQQQGRGGDCHDEKKGWSPLLREDAQLDYMDYSPPKVKYMLELKSVVCHVGYRLDAGHYRSYVADTASSSEQQQQQQHPLAFQEPNWLRHDDLDPSGRRVQMITRDSPEDMDMEADWARNGYILFYELQTVQC
ncbi:hypothetical protein EC957_006751 [Mortierella hygrophila]|uniref:ubiquitinyl hydrolase 1 n=1 Tax=Mortierella hygrophila TaxID=979708 RepID=A0A9P6EZ89_9FUNG|nr:hypothetical protein EC957_006751 [Mortierella hygrophila]